MYLDDKGCIVFPDIDKVIESGEELHMLALARVRFDDEDDTSKRDINLLFDAVIEQDNLGIAIDFVVECGCEWRTLKDLIIKQNNIELMKQFMEKTASCDTLVMLDALLESVAKRNVPSYLEDIIKPANYEPAYPYARNLHIGTEQLHRVQAVYKLLGGKMYDFG
jgi:hypothetical protein